MSKRKITLDPPPLDDDEASTMAALDGALERGALESTLTPARRAEIEAAARASLTPAKTQITTRLAKQDLIRLKARAMELGLPYQTLLASIVHQYLDGSLVERSRN